MPTNIIFDTEDEFAWDSIETTTDEAGELSQRVYNYDNGRVTDLLYQNGSVTKKTLLDNSADGSAANWEKLVYNYDLDGALTSRFWAYDSGYNKSIFYSDGVRSSQVDQDFSADGSLYSWDFRSSSFDGNGDLSSRFTQYDNGTTRTETYEAGVRTKLTQVDSSENPDLKNWTRIETDYDANGVREKYYVQYDNGTQTIINYSDGVIVNKFQTDGIDGSNAKSWDSIVSTYNLDGTISTKTTEYDDGRVKIDDYSGYLDEDGQLQEGRSSILVDQGDDFNWDAIVTTFDGSNTLVEKVIVYDNEDMSAFLYEGGNLNIRVDIDGDNSNTWLIRERIYDENNNLIETNLYNEDDELPDYLENGTNIDNAIASPM